VDFSAINQDDTRIPVYSDPGSTIFKISAGVGAGKTFGIAKTANGTYKGSPILYAAPTIALLTQTYNTMRDKDGENGFNLNPAMIHSNQLDHRGKPLAPPVTRLIDRLLNSPSNTQVLCTHATLLQLLSSTEFNRAFLNRWTCFIDEELKVVETLYFRTTTSEELTLAPQKKGIVEQAVKGQAENMALEAPRFKAILERILAPIYTVYGGVEGNLLSATGLLNPTKLYCFKEVVVVSAILEMTHTTAVWKHHFNIDMEHFKLDDELEYDPHTQGHRLTIHHLLPPGKEASVSRLSQGTVAADMAATVLGHWEGQGGVYIANKTLRNPSGGRKDNPIHDLLGSQTGVKAMPTVSHGLNEWEDATRIAVLSATQPGDEDISAMAEFEGKDMKEVRGTYRLTTCYQALGRTAIRDKDSTAQVDVIVLDERVALQLQSIFKGATVTGQLGDIQIQVGKGSQKKRPDDLSEKEGRALRAFMKRARASIRKGTPLSAEKQERYDFGNQLYPE
jgi:hypothetical protein